MLYEYSRRIAAAACLLRAVSTNRVTLKSLQAQCSAMVRHLSPCLNPSMWSLSFMFSHFLWFRSPIFPATLPRCAFSLFHDRKGILVLLFHILWHVGIVRNEKTNMLIVEYLVGFKRRFHVLQCSLRISNISVDACGRYCGTFSKKPRHYRVRRKRLLPKKAEAEDWPEKLATGTRMISPLCAQFFTFATKRSSMAWSSRKGL